MVSCRYGIGYACLLAAKQFFLSCALITFFIVYESRFRSNRIDKLEIPVLTLLMYVPCNKDDRATPKFRTGVTYRIDGKQKSMHTIRVSCPRIALRQPSQPETII